MQAGPALPERSPGASLPPRHRVAGEASAETVRDRAVDPGPHDTELIGYATPFAVAPGGTVEIKVHSTSARMGWEFVRLRHGDADPAGPGLLYSRMREPVAGVAEVGPQFTRPGSYGEIHVRSPFVVTGRLRVVLRVHPTTSPARGMLVAVVGADGAHAFSLALDEAGHLVWSVGRTHASVVSPRPLAPDRWYEVRGEVDFLAGAISQTVTDLRDSRRSQSAARVVSLQPALQVAQVRLAAGFGPGLVPGDHFNGKLEDPRISQVGDEPGEDVVLAAWDLGREPDSGRVRGTVAGCDGWLVNLPARAVTGSTWTGEEFSFRHAPEQYRAIHFHDDDLADAGWSTTLVLDIGPDCASAVYAVRLEDGPAVDYIPVYVVPSMRFKADAAPDAVDCPSARVALVLPTFTYAAYANDHQTSAAVFEENDASGLEVSPHWRARVLDRHPEYGKSLYAHHTDGSGALYSSLQRPVVTTRPDFCSPLSGGPRGLAQDLFIVRLLEKNGIDYDILTDHLLDEQGAGALAPYDVVLTGAHPEYASSAVLDALEHHLHTGGGLLYLGGNGFYWVASRCGGTLDAVEVRRNAGGDPAWSDRAGEYFHSSTGEMGGLWRHRGRPPNRLVGVGFTSQGFDAPASGFRATGDGDLADTAFLFEGVDRGLEFGAFGRLMGGSAGYELDRLDYRLQSPPDAVVVASSSRAFSDFYQLAREDTSFTGTHYGGSHDDRVRADMVCFTTTGGGSVFSAGSLSFTGAFPHDGFDNDCTKITLNAIHEFLRRSYSRQRLTETSDT